MKIIILMLLPLSLVFSQVDFDEYFLDKSLRLDYYETGNEQESVFSADELIEEPYWGGSKINLIDSLEFGNYFFKILDQEKRMTLYSRGFSHLFQEWQTTNEAKITRKSYSGSLVFPYPRKKVNAEVYKRDRDNDWEKIFEIAVDPDDYFIKKERRYQYDNFQIHNSGDHAKKYDIVMLPEGYTENELGEFREDCKKFTDAIFACSPFSEMKESINIWGVLAPSRDSGSDIPGNRIWASTLLNSSFYTFDSDRYLMTTDYKSVKDLAANAPYDQIVVLVNTRKYGGGAVYNYYTMTSAKHEMADRILLHELGHGIAGLADEYYTSDVAYVEFYPTDVEPWEPNITTLVDFDSKWVALMDSETPIPTPVNDEFKDSIGVFEGAGYAEKGVYRSSVNSIMLNLNAEGFNEVSRDAIIKVINLYSR